MKIAVIGMGYVGIVSTACLAENGNDIIGYDKVKEKIELLESGEIPIYEPGLKELINKNKDRIRFTKKHKEVYQDTDVIFICVGTPEKENGDANLEYIYEVVDEIIANINKDCVVVIKSTVPVGTNERVEAYIQEKIQGKYRIETASNPEFLAQSTAVKDMLSAERIVIGTHSKWAEDILKKIYNQFEDSELVCTDVKTAELSKYASNGFLALKISYINEIANLAEKLKVNIDDVTKIMGLDHRIGNAFLRPGIGFGGSCLPKDTKALYYMGQKNECEMKTTKAMIEVNEKQRLRLIEKAKKYYPSLEGLTVAILGVTFKPETDDLREAPAVYNIPCLEAEETKIKIWDPLGAEKIKKYYHKIESFNTIDDTIRNADICLIFTEWKEIKEYNIKNYEKLMKKSIVLDGRNCYSTEKFKNTNIIYEAIGKKGYTK